MIPLMDLFWEVVRNVLLLALLMLSGGVFSLFVFIAYLWWKEDK
jgi:hypothetical protein